MEAEKILEIGVEGGSVSFFNHVNHDVDVFTFRHQDSSAGNQGKFNTLGEAMTAFVSRGNPLIHFYPLYINPKYKFVIKQQLNKEVADLDEDIDETFPNKNYWEEELGMVFQPEKLKVQQFKISPLQKVETYHYERYADSEKMQQITTAFRDRPEYRIMKKGIGRISGNTFLLENEAGQILGIYPLNQYLVEIQSEKDK